MANRRSQNWLNQQRVDVPHLRSIESAVRNDFDELISSFAIGESASYILRGFEINMVGAIGSSASSLQLIVEESSLFHGKSNTSGTFFQVEAGTPNETLNSTTNTKVNGAFTPSSLNYIGLELKREVDTSTVSQLFFWNPTNQTEFSKSTPLAQLLDYEVVITSTVWDANVLPLAIVQTDSSNAVLSVEDRRPMFFRLGTAGTSSPDPFYEYPWNNHAEGRVENPFASSSSVSPFRGGDKQIKHLKEWADAVMSQIKELKGTTYWYSFNSGGSIVKLRNDVTNLVVTGSGKIIHSDATAGLLNWDEDFYLTYVTSRLQFKIAANPEPGAPGSGFAAANPEPGADLVLGDNEVAYIKTIRGQAITPRLIFTNGSAIVSSVGAVAWTADVQAGDWVKLAAEDDTRYFEIQSVDSLSQVTLVEVWDGTSTGSLGQLAEYAWGTYEVNASPSTDRHIQVAPRELVPFDEDVYWLFLRADNGGSVAKVYINGNGAELEQGEEAQISDNTTLEVLAYIGSPGEADATPDYTNAVTTGVAEETTYTFPAAAALAGGQSFNHNASVDIDKYTFYAVIDGSGSAPAAPGRVTVPVPFLSTDNANQVAAAYQSVIDAQDGLSAVDNLDGTVTVTNTEVGAATDATNNDMGAGFSISVDVQGAGAPNYALVDDENLTRGIKRVDQALAQTAATVGANTWKPPVANFAALPASGNTDGDVRLALDTRIAYHWDNAQALWLPLTGTGGGVKIIGGGTVSVSESQSAALEYLGVTLTSTVTFINAANQLVAQSFTLLAPTDVTSVLLNLRRSAGSGNINLNISPDDGGGAPDTPVAVSNPVDASTIGATNQDVEFEFASPVTLPAGTYFYYITGAGLPTISADTYSENPTVDSASSFDGGSTWPSTSSGPSVNIQVFEVGGGYPVLNFTGDMYLEIKGLTYSDNTIPTSESPIEFANDLDVAYVEPNLIAPGGNLTVTVDTLDNVPLTAIVIARREGSDIIVGSSSTRLAVGESIKLYDTKTDQDKDKMRGADYGFFRSNEQVTWTGTELQFTADIIFETINRAGTTQAYTVQAAGSPLVLADGEYAYLLIDRTQNTETVSFVINATLPAVPPAGFDIVVFAKRVDALGSGYLHLPLAKQVLEPGQTVRLGASGAGDVEGELDDHINDPTGAHAASAISYDGSTSGLSATTTQDAIDEVEGRVDQAELDIGTNEANLTNHEADTSAHGVSGVVVGTAGEQTLVQKTFDDELRLKELANTPPTPQAGYKKVYPKTDGKIYSLNSSGEERELGSGSGSGSSNTKLIQGGKWSLTTSENKTTNIEGAADDTFDFTDLRVAIKFEVSVKTKVSDLLVDLMLYRSGTDPSSLMLGIVHDNNDEPDMGIIITSSDLVPVNNLPLDSATSPTRFAFTGINTLNPGTYWFFLAAPGVVNGDSYGAVANPDIKYDVSFDEVWTSDARFNLGYALTNLNSIYTLEWSADAYIQTPGLTNERNTIPAGSVELIGPDQIAYVTMNIDEGPPDSLTVQVASNESLDDLQDAYVIARSTSDGVIIDDDAVKLISGDSVELYDRSKFTGDSVQRQYGFGILADTNHGVYTQDSLASLNLNGDKLLDHDGLGNLVALQDDVFVSVTYAGSVNTSSAANRIDVDNGSGFSSVSGSISGDLGVLTQGSSYTGRLQSGAKIRVLSYLSWTNKVVTVTATRVIKNTYSTTELLNKSTIARAYLSSNQAITSGSAEQINFDAVSKDDFGLFNLATGRATIKNSGWYFLLGSVFTENITPGAPWVIEFYNYTKSQGLSSRFVRGVGNDRITPQIDLQYLTAGTEISLRVTDTSGVGDILAGVGRTFFAIAPFPDLTVYGVYDDRKVIESKSPAIVPWPNPAFQWHTVTYIDVPRGKWLLSATTIFAREDIATVANDVFLLISETEDSGDGQYSSQNNAVFFDGNTGSNYNRLTLNINNYQVEVTEDSKRFYLNTYIGNYATGHMMRGYKLTAVPAK